jgi:hypothetical protein
MKTKLTAISLGLAVAGAVYLLSWPVYTNHAGKDATLVEVNGAWALVPVTFPVVIALVPLVYRKQAVRVVAAILMGGFALIAMSIGLFYLPSAIVMVLAACVGDAAKLRDALP